MNFKLTKKDQYSLPLRHRSQKSITSSQRHPSLKRHDSKTHTTFRLKPKSQEHLTRNVYSSQLRHNPKPPQKQSKPKRILVRRQPAVCAQKRITLLVRNTQPIRKIRKPGNNSLALLTGEPAKLPAHNIAIPMVQPSFRRNEVKWYPPPLKLELGVYRGGAKPQRKVVMPIPRLRDKQAVTIGSQVIPLMAFFFKEPPSEEQSRSMSSISDSQSVLSQGSDSSV